MPSAGRLATPCNKKRNKADPRFLLSSAIGGGNYLASAKMAGKVIRRCLETSDFNMAKNPLHEILAEIKGAEIASEAASPKSLFTRLPNGKIPTTPGCFRTISLRNQIRG